MNNKICQNCKQNFDIQPEDFKFYEKISVPPPTFCAECRMQRRFACRNERNLYKRNCNLCGKEIISMHQKSAPFPVYCQGCWWSDKWDPTGYGRDFDPSKPFFEQYADLQKLVPRPQYLNYESARTVNSPYTNCSGDIENCYLVFGSILDRNCAYSHYLSNSRDSFDMLYCEKTERCYECFDVDNSYNVSFSASSTNCVDSMFLFDCRNCNDCIGCSGLRNKKYNILNEPYVKEEYEKKKKELKLHTVEGIEALRSEFLNKVYQKTPRKYYHGQMNSGFSGDYISNTEKTYNSFYTKNTRSNKFCFWCINGQDVYDYFAWGDLEKSYEVISSGENSYNIKFTNCCWGGSRNIEYSDFCISSSDLFGCIGMRHKKFCILNKQYPENDYNKLRDKIIRQMNTMPYVGKDGVEYRYGEFLPIELSTIYYNDSVAQEHFPISIEDAQKKWYRWQEGERGQYTITRRGADLSGTISEVTDEILNDIIECDNCKRPYGIIEPELKFYREQDLPLPRLCPDCRHKERIKQRNPLKLWHRVCNCQGGFGFTNGESPIKYQNTVKHEHGDSPCPNEFETSYAPERPEIVYCEQCFLKEVV